MQTNLLTVEEKIVWSCIVSDDHVQVYRTKSEQETLRISAIAAKTETYWFVYKSDWLITCNDLIDLDCPLSLIQAIWEHFYASATASITT